VTETDYLIIGAGAVGMAFADTLLTETDAHLTIVDREAAPGGHWNHAYPFVALHQPSMLYGVNSLPLGTGAKDTSGHNAGLYELASGTEVRAYFDQVMRRIFLPSGRVTYHPSSGYKGDGTFVSLTSGAVSRLAVRRKTVDATYLEASVPALHTPRFLVEEGVQLVAPHRLATVLRRGLPPSGYVILGGGKTGMDVAHWLLTTGVPPDAITWIRPRESWLINRQAVQPAMDFFETCIGAQAAQMEAYAEAADLDDLFDRLERAGVMLRIDRRVRPGMMHFATISTHEIEVLQRIAQVIRRGRVRTIRAGSIEFADGNEPMCGSPMYIDCTASGAVPCSVQPVFQGDRIILQYILSPRTSLSAAMIAFVEANKHDDASKNALCEPVPMGDTVADYVPLILGNMANQQRQSHDSDLRAWLRTSRLDGFSGVMAAVDPDDAPKVAIVQRIRDAAPTAYANLMRIQRDRNHASDC
jgi:NAD(P)-binding Rossmann-like domain